MANILIVSGHTNLDDSVANKEILYRLKELLPDLEFDLLSELYPDYKIDVEKEQEKLNNEKKALRDELDSILYSRSYKFISKVKKIIRR